MNAEACNWNDLKQTMIDDIGCDYLHANMQQDSHSC